MNVIEFAERIVFGTTLEEKLLVPGKLTYESFQGQSPNVNQLRAPGRPVGLQMNVDRHLKLRPPADETLENERSRGQLLHFLANHELLATELMALVLLKFPEAPRAFRQGVMVTLQEEQTHTRMYIQRMKECGVEFGTYPLSGQFWRVIEPMQSPMDFVSRLSLTFEQANLDFSQHFAQVFKTIGDQETADVLQQIYEDEIGHVRHGLHWFQQWKNPGQSDWEAYQESLQFPMSPQRGRAPGIAFNRDGRIRAGLSETFVDAIEVFRKSRGRAATLRWFDPAAESELAGDVNPGDTQLFDQLARDLELAIVAVSKPDDVILVRQMPSCQWRRELVESGFELPEFQLFQDRACLKDRKLHDMSPWAWTPKSHQVAKELILDVRHPPNVWDSSNEVLFRKSWASGKLSEWLDDLSSQLPFDWFASQATAAVAVSHFEQIRIELQRISELGFENAIFKKDLATAGRGQRRIKTGLPSPDDLAWIQSHFDHAKKAESASCVGVIEPELDRICDVSFLWHLPCSSKRSAGMVTIESSGLEFCGWTQPLVNPGRRFAGTRLGNPFGDCDTQVKRFLLSDNSAKLQSVRDWLQPRLAKELVSRSFQGYFGVDAFVFRDFDGQLKIRPLVELNPRMTMGHIALSLQKHLAPGVVGEFRIFTRKEWNEVESLLHDIPILNLDFHRARKGGPLKSGVIKFGEFDEKTKLFPTLLVGRQATEAANRCGSAF